MKDFMNECWGIMVVIVIIAVFFIWQNIPWQREDTTVNSDPIVEFAVAVDEWAMECAEYLDTMME